MTIASAAITIAFLACALMIAPAVAETGTLTATSNNPDCLLDGAWTGVTSGVPLNSWTVGESSARFDFVDSTECGGSATETQTGSLTKSVTLAASTEVTITVYGSGEDDYEEMKFSVDNVMKVEAKASAETGTVIKTCGEGAGTRNIVSVPASSTTITLAAGTYEFKFEVTTTDEEANTGFFQMGISAGTCIATAASNDGSTAAPTSATTSAPTSATTNAEVAVIVATFELAGDLETFDESAFIAGLSELIEVETWQITIVSVQRRSVTVVANVVAETEAQTSVIESSLAAIVATDVIGTSTVLGAVSTACSGVGCPSNSSSSSDTLLIVLLVCGAVVLLTTIVVILIMWWKKKCCFAGSSDNDETGHGHPKLTYQIGTPPGDAPAGVGVEMQMHDKKDTELDADQEGALPAADEDDAAREAVIVAVGGPAVEEAIAEAEAEEAVKEEEVVEEVVKEEEVEETPIEL